MASSRESGIIGLANRIRRCAEMAGSGDTLARKAAIPRRTLETYLAGRAEPKTSRLVAIAKAVGVSIDWLATGEGPVERGDGLDDPAREPAPGRSPGPSGAPPGLDHLDEELLIAAVCAVDEYLVETGLVLDSERKAQLIGLLYDIVFDEEAAERTPAIRKNVTRLFKLVS